jgi:hypothetical protein
MVEPAQALIGENLNTQPIFRKEDRTLIEEEELIAEVD